MRWVFDWLREQMEKVKCEVYSPADVVWNNSVKMCFREVNEAEAKWEKDCCEWECQDRISVLGHDKLMYTHTVRSWTYCPYCGKPIKISEVE